MIRALLILMLLASACDKGTRSKEVAPGSAAPCVIGGCNGEVCDEPGETGGTACVMLDEFACYGTATCERQPTGKCGWTQTSELTKCIATARANRPPPVAGPPTPPADDGSNGDR